MCTLQTIHALLCCRREAPIDVFDKYGHSPLMQAAQKGYVEYV